MNLTAIKNLCQEHRITIAELERATHLSNGVIAKWANGFPRVDNLQAVASYFGTSIDSLLADDNSQEGRTLRED